MKMSLVSANDQMARDRCPVHGLLMSVHANFCFIELAFVLAKFSLLRLNKKQRNLPYVFVFKKVGDK